MASIAVMDIFGNLSPCHWVCFPLLFCGLIKRIASFLGKGYTVEHQVKKMIKEQEKEKQKATESTTEVKPESMDVDNDDKDENESDKEEKEEIFEDVGGIQFEVYPKYNENIHIAVDEDLRFPEGFNQFRYKKDLLDSTPSDKSLKVGERAYFFSHSLPKSMYRDIINITKERRRLITI